MSEEVDLQERAHISKSTSEASRLCGRTMFFPSSSPNFRRRLGGARRRLQTFRQTSLASLKLWTRFLRELHELSLILEYEFTEVVPKSQQTSFIVPDALPSRDASYRYEITHLSALYGRHALLLDQGLVSLHGRGCTHFYGACAECEALPTS